MCEIKSFYRRPNSTVANVLSRKTHTPFSKTFGLRQYAGKIQLERQCLEIFLISKHFSPQVPAHSNFCHWFMAQTTLIPLKTGGKPQNQRARDEVYQNHMSFP